MDWKPQLPWEYRLRAIDSTTLGEARTLREPAFVKPPNDKSFPTAVYAGATLAMEYPDDMPVLVSEIVTWEKRVPLFRSGSRSQNAFDPAEVLEVLRYASVDL